MPEIKSAYAHQRKNVGSPLQKVTEKMADKMFGATLVTDTFPHNFYKQPYVVVDNYFNALKERKSAWTISAIAAKNSVVWQTKADKDTYWHME